MSKKIKNLNIVGVDEVGRGPLAGPIVFCAVKIPVDVYHKLKKDKLLPKNGLDSKKIKEKDREKFSDYLKILKQQKKVDFSVVGFSNKMIDKFGLSKVQKLTIFKCLKNISIKKDDIILLDGGLKAPNDFLNQKTIIKGDEKEKIIAWASILAKVFRDNLMKKEHLKYPQYDFINNVGYGTKKHKEAIKKYGICQIHRKTFLKS
jgi:ribonuclease HII